MAWSNPTTKIAGIGEKHQRSLAKIGIHTCLDLVFHLPTRYEDRTSYDKLAECYPGRHEYFINAEVIDVVEQRGRSGLHVTIQDDSGTATLRLIHYGPSQVRLFENASKVRLFGTMSQGGAFIHPDYTIVRSKNSGSEFEYRPVYPLTSQIGRGLMRKWVSIALQLELALLPKHTHDGLTLEDALQGIHAPKVSSKLSDLDRLMQRVRFDEMVAFFLTQQISWQQLQRAVTTPLPRSGELANQLVKNMGFSLTDAQIRVTREIYKDLEQDEPMHRLLQGDVGSGKTVVAALAATRVAENQFQTAIMAPTEILSEQHYETLSQLLSPLGISVTLLTSSVSAKARRTRISAIAQGDVQVVVGTHALIQGSVNFKRLGLVVIDEQHRFGVHQRMTLRGKGNEPHQLVMTATPIPRTLAQTMFAHLHVSTIDELPKGRPKVTTTLHADAQRGRIIQRINQQISQGRQVYWVCPAIEASDESDLTAAVQVAKELNSQFEDVSIGLVHGKMKSTEKTSVMQSFRDGETQVLVATTVIEVGIDVANASIIVIEDADHFGLAQLHQLRGRVGRGTTKSHCLLLYKHNLSSVARTRLDALREHHDGYKLAEIDLKTRGSGELHGITQSGESFRFATLEEFNRRFDEVKSYSDNLLQNDQELVADIIRIWSRNEAGYLAA